MALNVFNVDPIVKIIRCIDAHCSSCIIIAQLCSSAVAVGRTKHIAIGHWLGTECYVTRHKLSFKIIGAKDRKNQ